MTMNLWAALNAVGAKQMECCPGEARGEAKETANICGVCNPTQPNQVSLWQYFSERKGLSTGLYERYSSA